MDPFADRGRHILDLGLRDRLPDSGQWREFHGFSTSARDGIARGYRSDRSSRDDSREYEGLPRPLMTLALTKST